MRVVVLLFLAGVLFAGCGYKGPLYVPKPKPEAQRPAPAPDANQDAPSSQ